MGPNLKFGVERLLILCVCLSDDVYVSPHLRVNQKSRIWGFRKREAQASWSPLCLWRAGAWHREHPRDGWTRFAPQFPLSSQSCPSQALSPTFWGSGILLCMPPSHSTTVKGSKRQLVGPQFSLEQRFSRVGHRPMGSAPWALCYQLRGGEHRCEGKPRETSV